MNFTIGVLIVGSLYWDTDLARRDWRRSRLIETRSIDVRVPIRYGRRSSRRGKAYTMVYSMNCAGDPNLLGVGKILPCKANMLAIASLKEEARELWIAECAPSKPDHEFSADWGCVGLLCNPSSGVPQEFLEKWSDSLSHEPGYSTLKHLPDEPAVITSQGILQFPWPSQLNGVAVPFDLLLATATDPTLEREPVRYASAEIIASAWMREPKQAEYFWKNLESGIRTFQDADIERTLGRNSRLLTQRRGCLGPISRFRSGRDANIKK